jgi:putative transposase
MARPLRLQLPGACYLVTARARQRDTLFPQPADRAAFLELLARTCARYRWRCHAYCLANDHYQLVIRIETASLGTGMRHLNSVYSQLLNRRHASGGNLFEGRYESAVVDASRYLVEAVTQVLRTPVREGLSARVADWPWSSVRATVGQLAPPPWLAVAEVLRGFADDPEVATSAFSAALERKSPATGDATQSIGNCLADADFMLRLLARAPRRVTARAGRLRRAQRPPLADFSAAHADRREAMRAAWHSGCYTQKEIARHFNVHTATVSRAVAPVQDWPLTSPPYGPEQRHAAD